MGQPPQALVLDAVPLLAAASVFGWIAIGVAIGVAGTLAGATLVLRRWPRPETARRADLESVAELPTVLGGADDAEGVARAVVEHVESLLGVDLVALALVTDDGRRAHGFLARANGRELDSYREVEFDLKNEPSGVATAVFEGAPFTVFDLAAAPRSNRRLPGGPATKSAAFVPLIAEQRVLAVLTVATTDERRAFTTAELSLLQALAGEAALALDRARSTAELAAVLERQAGLLRAAQDLASELQTDAVLHRVVEHLAALLRTDAADCYLLDPDRFVLRCVASHGLGDGVVGSEFPADGGLAGRALAEGRSVVADDYGGSDAPAPSETYAEFRAAMVAPLRWGDAFQGVLGVGVRGERRFSADDAELLDAYAGLVALALANAQAFEVRSRQARIQRGFFRIATALGQSVSLDETLEAVAQAANDALAGTSTAVLMPRGGRLEIFGAVDVAAVLSELLDGGIPESARILRGVAADGRILASSNISKDDRFEAEWRESVDRAGLHALLAVPITTPHDSANGLVVIFFAGERTFADDDLELARHLAAAARGALERTELFEAERTNRALAQQLARTGGVLATELDPTAVLDEVVQQAPELLAADACAIRIVEGDELVIGAAWGERTEATVGARGSSEAWLSGDVFQSRAPVAVEDAAADERLVEADPIVAAGYPAFLGVPLAGPEGALHGVLAVYAGRPRTWRQEEVEALLALAGNTSAALSNAELYSRVSIEKERSVAILANIADGIVAVDRDGDVVLWNAAAEQITGVPAAEALGHALADILQRSLDSDAPDAHSGPRLVSILRGGEEVWLSLSEAVMRDPLGGVAGRIFAFRDISADRMIEQVKSDFVAAVSHELRTPLTSIYGFAETLLRRDVLFGEEERRTFIGYIASESERLTEIVDQLLNVARLDVGDLLVEPESIDVASVVSEVVETAEETGAVNGHRFEVDLPSEPLAAEADRDKLRQVFTILVENAFKYSPDGGTVTVGARRKDDAVEVRVVDEGVGIPAGERERIFRKFYRAESTVRDGAGGTGLGLFIARELVTAMGGRIWVESEEGSGSSFAFELPLAERMKEGTSG